MACYAAICCVRFAGYEQHQMDTEGLTTRETWFCLLQRLALASKDIRTSIVVHGGTQQLLDLVQAGFQKVRLTLQLMCVKVDMTSASPRNALMDKPAACVLCMGVAPVCASIL